MDGFECKADWVQLIEGALIGGVPFWWRGEREMGSDFRAGV